jgi:hypothetical protein
VGKPPTNAPPAKSEIIKTVKAHFDGLFLLVWADFCDANWRD